MIIGIDIDDTISNSSDVFFKYGTLFNKENNINSEIKLDVYDLCEAFGWDDKNFNKFVKNYFSNFLDEVCPQENAVNVINTLKNEGNKIVIITARSTELFEDPYRMSADWLDKYKISYDKLVVNGADKGTKCLENNVELFIDDLTANCLDVYKKTHRKPFLMTNHFNQKDFAPEVIRVSNWNEIYDKIETMASCMEV